MSLFSKPLRGAAIGFNFQKKKKTENISCCSRKKMIKIEPHGKKSFDVHPSMLFPLFFSTTLLQVQHFIRNVNFNNNFPLLFAINF